MQSRFPSITLAKAWAGTLIPPNQELLILINSIYTRWRFDLGSVATDTTEQLIFAPTTSPATGKWRRIDPMVDLKLPVDFSLANNAVLLTVPTGFILHPINPWLEVTTAFTGGAASAIGIDSSNAAYNTAGDLIGGDNGGGVAGLVAADLTIGMRGRIGPKLLSEYSGSLSGAGQGPVILVAGDTVRWNRITSVFTTGVGFLHFPVIITQV